MKKIGRRQRPIFSSLEALHTVLSAEGKVFEPSFNQNIAASTFKKEGEIKQKIDMDLSDTSLTHKKIEVNVSSHSPATATNFVRLSTENHDYGRVLLGNTENLELTVYNEGDNECTILNLKGIPTNGFRLENMPELPFTIPPHESKAFTVLFAPVSEGKKELIFAITTNNQFFPKFYVFLTGTAVIPRDTASGYIGAAIDKSRQRTRTLKNRLASAPLESGGAAPYVPAAVLPTVSDRPVPPEGDGFVYTVTRTTAVDLDTLRRHRLIVGEEATTAAEEYKLVCTPILHSTREEGRNTLMVTSPLPGEGKTITAINLAISISQEVDQTALLVDADLRVPSVHRYFGLPNGPGLVDYLTAGVPISELLVHPQGLAKLVLLPAGQPTGQSAELLNSPRMAELVQELKNFYPDRYVIFDLPPVLSYADAQAFAPKVDGIIMVVEAGRTPREEIERSLEMLKKFPVLGLVLNKDLKKNFKYYYYLHEKPPKTSWWKRITGA